MQVPSYRSAGTDTSGEDFARAMESMEVQRLQAEVRFLRDQLDLEKAEGDKWLLVNFLHFPVSRTYDRLYCLRNALNFQRQYQAIDCTD